MITRYICGHVGTMTTPGKKMPLKVFIRVAEIRGKPVEDSEKNCPDCRRSEGDSR
jgi:hypothetical protein